MSHFEMQNGMMSQHCYRSLRRAAAVERKSREVELLQQEKIAMFWQVCKALEEVESLRAEVDWWRHWWTEDFIMGEQEVGMRVDMKDETCLNVDIKGEEVLGGNVDIMDGMAMNVSIRRVPEHFSEDSTMNTDSENENYEESNADSSEVCTKSDKKVVEEVAVEQHGIHEIQQKVEEIVCEQKVAADEEDVPEWAKTFMAKMENINAAFENFEKFDEGWNHGWLFRLRSLGDRAASPRRRASSLPSFLPTRIKIQCRNRQQKRLCKLSKTRFL